MGRQDGALAEPATAVIDIAQAKIAVIGLGYVGLPLAVAFGRRRPVVGFDISAGRIAELPWSEVSAARIDGREPIPLLEDVLTTWPTLRVNIDPKADTAVDPLIDVLTRTRAVDRVCVASFSDARTDQVREALGPDLCTGMGPDEMVGLVRAFQGEDVAFRSQAAQIPPVDHRGRPLATPELVEVAHAHGIAVHVWTIDDPDEMRALLDVGVDGIMTDRPAVLRQVFEARGIWR